MKEQRVEIEISADGHNLKIDLVNYEGTECEEEMNHLKNHLGLTEAKITKKPEFFQEETSNRREVHVEQKR